MPTARENRSCCVKDFAARVTILRLYATSNETAWLSYSEFDEGHRIGLEGDVVLYAQTLYDKGLMLEGILIAHEYFEHRLNAIYYRVAFPGQPKAVHRKFKESIESLRSKSLLGQEEYEKLNDFNRLRNTSSNRMLDFTLQLRGAKKGDLARAISLAQEIDNIISDLIRRTERPAKSKSGKKAQKL